MARATNAAVAGLVLNAVALAQPPAITPHGIVNAASLMPPSLAGGKLAPGARIVIPGIRLKDAGSETRIRVEQGDWSATISPASLDPSRIEAILPKDLPLGQVKIALVNGQGSSRAEEAEVAASSPGIYSMNGQGWGPAVRDPVERGKKITLRVNGLNESRPKVFVGGSEARDSAAHGENVTFTVPRDAPEGCWTPVWIQSRAGGASNFVTISIRGPGRDCQQLEGWPARPVKPGSRNAVVMLHRVRGSLELHDGMPNPFQFDSGAGVVFVAGDSEVTPFQILPPGGTCASQTGTFTLDFGAFFSVRNFVGGFERGLDAGPSFRIEAESGEGTMRGSQPGLYAALLGGTAPVMWGPGTPLLLTPGSHRVRAEGSDEMGKLDVGLDIPPMFDWIGEDQIKEIDRSKGLELRWRNLARDRQMVIVAFSVDSDNSATGAAVCVATPDANQMTIPSYALANLPATRPNGVLPVRVLILASLPRKASGAGPVEGLNDARVILMDVRGKNVVFR